MNYQQDNTYKQHLQNIELEVEKIINKLQDDKGDIVAHGEDKKKELETTINKHWEQTTSRYHQTMAYLKDKFGMDQDEVLEHKLKSAIHKAKQAGYELKEDFLLQSA